MATVTVPLATLNTEQFPVLNVANGIVPDEALAIPITLSFTPSVTAMLIDVTESALKFNTIPIQGVYIDMSAATMNLSLQIPGSGQMILAKSGTQGYYAVLSPMPVRVIVQLSAAPAAALNLQIILYNTPIEPCVWGYAQGPIGPQGPPGPQGPSGGAYTLPPATATVLGGVKIDGGLNVLGDGTLSVAAATASVVGGVKAGTGVNIAADGTLSVPVLAPATATVLGGVKVGTNVSVAGDGTISVPPVAGFQTPWLSNINGATFSLSNVTAVSANNYSFVGTTASPSYEQWTMNGLLRWRWVIVTAESGSNAGSNLVLQGYADDGSTILDASALFIQRASGNVGIGTNNPTGVLHVAPSAGDANVLIDSSTHGGHNWGLVAASSGPVWAPAGSFSIVDDTAVAARMTISPTGNVGIGTTSPTTTLDVNGTGRFAGSVNPTSGAGIEVSYGAGTGAIYSYDRGASAWRTLSLQGSSLLLNAVAAGNVGIGVGIVPAHLLQLQTDDAAKPTTNTWIIASGAKVKRHVKRLKGGLDIINKLSPTEAEYNGKAGTPEGQRVVSLIAEEVREILPHTVTEDSEGNLGFNVHEVIHHLILAVQQLSAEVKKRK